MVGWYRNQAMQIMSTCHSVPFTIPSGVRYGKALSTQIFSVYLMSFQYSWKQQAGCTVGNIVCLLITYCLLMAWVISHSFNNFCMLSTVRKKTVGIVPP